jgi:hypothetical protein
VTGLIYLVIIALWAAVLIPMWLRRHDQISEVRSTARFSSAMRSLGSQGPAQYAMEMSLGSMSPAPTEVHMPRPSAAGPARTPRDDQSRERARQAAASRRAIVLGALTSILLVALVAALLGVAPKWAAALAVLPVIGFIAASVVTAAERSSAPARRPQQRAVPVATADRTRQEAPAPTETEAEWETWNAWDDDDQSWEAVPTTLPTYVDAPRASAVPRGIDRATPGEWTGSAMVETAQAMRSRRRNDPLQDSSAIDHGAETAEIPAIREDYQTRTAVNE